MRLRRVVLLLYLTTLHQVVKNSKSHIRAQRTGTIAQQQGRMHRLANLAALHDERRLHTLADTDEMVMDGTDGQQ